MHVGRASYVGNPPYAVLLLASLSLRDVDGSIIRPEF